MVRLLEKRAPAWQVTQPTFCVSLNSAAPRWTAVGLAGAGRSGRGCASIHDSIAFPWSEVELRPRHAATNTSAISASKFASSPLQWNGSVPRRPVCSDCVRRSPGRVAPRRRSRRSHTRPSSLPSRWQDAHAMKPPAFAWKKRWPVSARLSRRQVDVAAVRSRVSIAGSRDWTTTLPSPANATAIGCPTTCRIRRAAGHDVVPVAVVQDASCSAAGRDRACRRACNRSSRRWRSPGRSRTRASAGVPSVRTPASPADCVALPSDTNATLAAVRRDRHVHGQDQARQGGTRS